ncbi:PilZ domain-containing protein [Marispirochaeta sp.]|jgi:hypothetical protein|uniref:PilZ domain-containing protein n=1 Tax=Marispirochaeta sp. TaxID=2038653 RepID=UPI0029C85801|nr:PilZ domain-containing protein [Marispirochaeta sp.]
MDFLERIWKAIYQRSLNSGPVETAVFLILIFLFIAFLLAANKRRKIRERETLYKAWEAKWNYYIKKFEITPEEAAFITQLAAFLETPEKRYSLLVDSHVFNACLRKHLQKGGNRDDLARSVLYKARLKPISEEVRAVALTRRKLPRRKVDITATLTPVGHDDQEFTARMYDLSSHGASVENPEKRFSERDDLKISFSYQHKKYRNIGAEVLRVSRKGERLHLKFHRHDS